MFPKKFHFTRFTDNNVCFQLKEDNSIKIKFSLGIKGLLHAGYNILHYHHYYMQLKSINIKYLMKYRFIK